MSEVDTPVGEQAAAAVPARDPEEAQRALVRVQALLEKQRRVESLVHREATPAEEKKALVESLVHRQHLTELKTILDRLHPADIAYILEALPRDDRLVVWDSVKAERDGEILLEVSDAVRETLIASMDREELVDAVETLEADEIAALADDLPADVVEEVKQGLTTEERAQLRAAMSYPEDSVGARMDFEMVSIRDDVTLEVVLRYLRRFDALPDHTDQVFVVDRDDMLKGSLPLDRLLINEPDTKVADVMKADILTLAPLDDVSEAAQAFERYDLVSAPVVDANGRLIGRLTVDEVVDVIREESEERDLANAGLREEEDLFSSVWKSAKNRWMWLAINMGTAFFASRVIGAFEGTIERVVALAALMPIVAGIAGNSGNQTLTLLVRSLALGQVTGANARRLIYKEIGVAVANGVVWGGLAGVFAYLLYQDSPQGVQLGVVMFLAMVLNMLVGALVGLAVPLALRALGRDPAIGGSVLLTFTTDSGGFFIFLGLATLFFR
ncbi:magnesium transporter [Betaproteobacteria bacterium PRO7]|jgi:magnesium transporter|nr:magnesium transporter [Betaproteobacteria bacterium PRO7]GIL05432.1 MAG: magnesium transporter MgtE [Betaproteobacteria bacterium]